ncbi:MAG: TlpA family protein disulfide reductase [Fimbriimonadaceae bacterium]
MKHFSLAIALLGAVAVSTADELKPLTIGDPAPAFKVTGWAKGEPIKELKKGNVYVVEFWATWCGPCIASMPHLSEMAKKFEGKATFVSINTWDFEKNEAGVKETDPAHLARVKEWVEKNSDKMKYNVAYDDSKDFMSTTWMRAAGRNGIPCAFIVNADQQITWIGHPMEMEKVLDEVVANTWDMKAFKVKFDEQAAKAREAAALRTKMVELAKAGDMAGFGPLMAKTGVSQAISNVMSVPNFAIQLIEKHAGKVEGMPAYSWCSMAAYIAGHKDSTPESKATAVKVSEMCFSATPEGQAALGAAYHARCLFNAGKKDEAMTWIDKAASLVDKYSPENERPGILKFINDSKKQFSANG